MNWWKALPIGLFLMLVVGAACNGGNGGNGGVNDAPYNPQFANLPTDVAACQALNRFDRYRYVYTYRWLSPKPEMPLDETQVGNPPFALPPNSETFDFSQTFEGAIINPDRIDMVVKTVGGLDTAFRWVEGQAWTISSGEWLPVGEQAVFFPPALVCHAVMNGLDLTGVAASNETVAELEADHYRLEQVPLETAATLWGAQSDQGRLLTAFNVDVWLTEEGWPARLEAKSEANYPSGREFSAELSLEIRDVNSEDISVEPPTN